MTPVPNEPSDPCRRLAAARSFLAAARVAAAECHASLCCAELAGDLQGRECATLQIAEVNGLAAMASRAVLEAEDAVRREAAEASERVTMAVHALLERGPCGTRALIARGIGNRIAVVVPIVDRMLAQGRVKMIPGKGYMLTTPIARSAPLTGPALARAE